MIERAAGVRRRRTVWLVAATVACYAVGYPLALVGGYAAGWVLVSLGGVLLLVLGAGVVRALERNSRNR